MFRIVAPTVVLPTSVHTNFIPDDTTGYCFSPHDFDHRERGRRMQIVGLSDLGPSQKSGTSSIFTWVQADTASLASPAQSSSLDITSNTLAAVMCDAEDLCSANTAYDPESFL